MAGRIAYLGNISPQGLVLDLDAGIKGSYPKTGSTWFDISNNGNNGTLTNGPLYTGSNYGAIVFDGVNDYVVTPTTNYVSSTSSPISGFAWINIARFTTCSIWQIGEYLDNNYATGLGIDGTTLSWVGNGPFSSITKSPTNINTGSWVNVGMIKTGNSITFYQNGSPSNASSGYGTTIGPNPITIGVGSRNQGREGFFSGSIAQAQIYNQALTQFQVWQNFNAYKSRYGIPDIVTDGLVLNLDAGNPYSYLSGSSGTTWTNVAPVSSSISGSLVNGPVYSNGTIFLDGTNDYIDCGTSPTLTFNNGTDLNDIPFSIGAWVKFNSVLGYQLVIAKSDYGSVPNKREFLFFTNNNSKIYFNLMNSNNYNNRIGRYYNTVLTTNVWYYLCATYDGSKLESGMKIYINGVRVDDTSDSAGTYSGLSRTTTPFCFGTDWNNYPNQGNKLNGYYGTGQVYRKELTAAEVQQNFNALRGRYGI